MNKNYIKEMRVLYVEDEDDIREELADFLSSKVKELYIAQNGEEGLKLFREKDPDFVITDIQMPVMNGLDMAKEIKDVNRHTPVIVTTAFSDSSFMIKAINIGVDSYVLKPVNIKQLIESIEITSRIMMQENELKRKDKFLKEYMHAIEASAIMTKTDPAGRITFVNKEFCEISGYQEEELLGKNHNIIRHPETQVSVFKEMWETIQSKRTWRGKIKNLKKDGGEFSVIATIIPILDENEEISEFVAIRQNITELEEYREHLEEKVIEETEKNRKKDSELISTLTAFMEASPNPIVVYEGPTVKYVNGKFLAMTKKEKEEILGKEFDMESLFEKRSGCISKVSDMEADVSKNKVSVHTKYGRSIFNILKNDIVCFDDRVVDMYTFNNITVNEYQKLKIKHYNARLEDFITMINSKRVMEAPKKDAIKSEKAEMVRQDKVQKAEKTEKIETHEAKKEPKVTRELSSAELHVLKKSRKDRALSSAEYAEEIDEIVLQEIQELVELELEIDEELTMFEESKSLQNIYNIAGRLLKYSSTVSQLFEFEDLAFAIKSLADVLGGMEAEKIDGTKLRKLELFLSNIMIDLSNWRRIIFVEKSANDIHYLDASLFSAILQLELAVTEKEEVATEDGEDDDFELF